MGYSLIWPTPTVFEGSLLPAPGENPGNKVGPIWGCAAGQGMVFEV